MKLTEYHSIAAPNGVDFNEFIGRYRDKLQHLFNVRTDLDKLSLNRGFPPFVLREILSCDPLTVFIPSEYGGRGGVVQECLSMLEASSYHSLPLSLTMGINGALFLQPLTRYGQEEIKKPIFTRFIRDKTLGGLMITEPDYGSDALRMQTSYRESDGFYHIEGLKHWGGLTGWADFWLLTARAKDGSGQLARDIDFFVWDSEFDGIRVEEVFENLGLYLIPYGRNRINTRLPKTHRLQPHSTGIKMMLDILHRSRLEFPGMAMGYLRRLLDEGLAHCKQRDIGGQSLFSYDQVKARLARIQASFTTCSAMCAFTSGRAGVENDLSKAAIPANAIKSVITDLMQDAAQSLLQLTGANGYRLDHIAGRSIVDSRSFQIFEGSNDILYQQISEAVLKSMRGMKQTNLYEYLKTFEFTSKAADYFRDTLSFEVDLRLPQRKLVDLGRAVGRIISMNMVIDLGERGFRKDMISNCIVVLRQEVESIVATYNHDPEAPIVDEYVEGSEWLNCVSPSS